MMSFILRVYAESKNKNKNDIEDDLNVNFWEDSRQCIANQGHAHEEGRQLRRGSLQEAAWVE